MPAKKVIRHQLPDLFRRWFRYPGGDSGPIHNVIREGPELLLFCVGMAKTGTHSMAEIWGNGVKAGHEPDSKTALNLILSRNAGTINQDDYRDKIAAYIKNTGLNIIASQLNFFYLDILIELYPAALFILTIREPRSWLDSFINHQLTRECSREWQQLRDLRFRPDLHRHPPEEEILKKHGLYTLDGYFGYWHFHNSRVIKTIPAERLLIIRTDKINDSIDDISRFAGLNRNSEPMKPAHIFPAAGKLNIPHSLDREYLERKISQHCGTLLQQYFL